MNDVKVQVGDLYFKSGAFLRVIKSTKATVHLKKVTINEKGQNTGIGYYTIPINPQWLIRCSLYKKFNREDL